MSAEELAQTLSLEESSVYRNLETLERHGLIRHVHLGHGPGLYALVGRGEREYLYCDRCGKVTVLAPEELAVSARTSSGGLAISRDSPTSRSSDAAGTALDLTPSLRSPTADLALPHLSIAHTSR